MRGREMAIHWGDRSGPLNAEPKVLIRVHSQTGSPLENQIAAYSSLFRRPRPSV